MKILFQATDNTITYMFEIVDNVIGQISANAVVQNLQTGVTPVFLALVTLGLIFLGLNMMFQWKQMSYEEFFKYLLIAVVTGSIGLVYVNITSIFNVLISVPNSVASALLNATGAGEFADLNEAYARMWDRSVEITASINENGGWISGAVATLIYAIIAGLFIAIGTVALIAYELLIAVLLLLSPLFVILFILPSTRRYTEGFVSTVVAVTIFPIVLAAITALILVIEEQIDIQTEFSFSYIVEIMFIYMVGLLLLMLSGFVVTSIAGASADIAGSAMGVAKTTATVAAGGAYLATKYGGQTAVGAAKEIGGVSKTVQSMNDRTSSSR